MLVLDSPSAAWHDTETGRSYEARR
jgi:heme-degrading monooxygenase HmoA